MNMHARQPRQRQQQLHTALADFIDFGHLERYTMGEPSLTRELLQMFCDELKHFRQADRGTREKERQAVHRLKGTARAVGAFPLAEAAAWLEKLLDADADEADVRDARDDLNAHLDALSDACRRWKEALLP